jgi:hypothetical protein
MSVRPPTALRPKLTLAEIYGPRTTYNPRPSYRNYGWLPGDAVSLDGRTSAALTVAGAMPTICSRGGLADALFELWEQAGIDASPSVMPYCTQAEYERCLAQAERQGQRLVFQHVHAPGERPATQYWVPAELMSYLNDKSHLPELTPSEFVLPRRLVPPSDLSRLIRETPKLPIVIKGCGPQSSGGGRAVVIVRRPADWLVARQRLATGERIVVEQYLQAVGNYCLTFAAMPDSTVRYLGAAEQVTDGAGSYGGNWLDPRREPPAAAVEAGREIMRRAQLLGYRGVAGFDVIVDAQGAVRVIDLNFRLNGSTPALLWQPTLRERFGPACVMRYQSGNLPGSMADCLGLLRGMVRRGDFFPLAVFDPLAGRHPGAPARIDGLWLGTSREEADAKRAALLGSGGAALRAA